MVLRTLPLALLALLLFPGAAAAAPSAGRIIVEHEPGLSAAERADVRADAGVRLLDPLPLPRTEVVSVASGSVAEALRELRADRDVVYAVRDRPVHALAADPDPDLGIQWAVPRLQLATAWATSTGSGQTVAVVDSGVQADHPDLAGGVLAGHDWVDDDAIPDDEEGHGTHVSGIVAARRDNGEGGAGGAPNAPILPLRVLDADGAGTTSDVIAAFDFAGDAGVRVVNASLGGTGSITPERDMIAAHPDTLFVAAAGNSNADNDDAATAEYPCSYDLANVLCVGASTTSDTRAVFSNYGSRTVDVFAPGEDIWSTLPGGTYGYSDGTSMATPFVAAVAALALQAAPDLTTAELKTLLMQTAERKQSLDGLSVTGGRVNARAAVQLAAGGQPIGDRDNDGIGDTVDACPDVRWPYAANGCRPVGDTDGDGRLDTADNCANVANPTQADADRDGAGDACDSTPRGPDVDRDGRPALDDACPTVPAGTPNGCPAPPPPPPADSDGDGRIDIADLCPTEPAATPTGCPVPALVSAKATVKRRTRTVRLTLLADRAATVRVTVERKKCRQGKRCRWVRAARRTVSAPSGRAKIVLRRARKGTYRARVQLSSDAGRSRVRTLRYRVR